VVVVEAGNPKGALPAVVVVVVAVDVTEVVLVVIVTVVVLVAVVVAPATSVVVVATVVVVVEDWTGDELDVAVAVLVVSVEVAVVSVLTVFDEPLDWAPPAGEYPVELARELTVVVELTAAGTAPRLRAEPTSPQPASVEVATASNSRPARAAFDLSKLERSAKEGLLMINTFVRTLGQRLIKTPAPRG
jgi:hypothetical protein